MRTVRDIMVRDPVVIEPDATVRQAAGLMNERNINSVVVCREGRIEGIFTSRDLLRRAAEGEPSERNTVADHMTVRPATVEASTGLETAFDIMDQLHIRHLPVVESGRLVGMISVRDLMRHRAKRLEELVRQQTAELEARHAELQARDRNMQLHLELAGRLQQELLPAIAPALDPFSLAVAYQPLHHVSGDTYDFTVLPGDRLGVLIADARGHGVPAAFVSVMARMVFQAIGGDGLSPARLLRAMNDRLPQLIQADHFITMCYAVIDRRNLRMTWAAAGHPPPLRFSHVDSAVERLEARGDLIGVLEDPDFEERTVQLRHKDTVLFYTDGLIEARNGSHEHFGEQRVTGVLERQSGAACPDLLASLRSELDGFCGGEPPADDLTCIALRIE